MDTATVPVSGLVRLPPDLLDRAMHARAITTEQLAEKAGVAPNTILSARRGRPIAVKTLRKLDAALALFPILSGPLGDGLRIRDEEGAPMG